MVAFDNGSSTKRRLQAEQSVQSLNFDGIPIGLRRPYLTANKETTGMTGGSIKTGCLLRLWRCIRGTCRHTDRYRSLDEGNSD